MKGDGGEESGEPSKEDPENQKERKRKAVKSKTVVSKPSSPHTGSKVPNPVSKASSPSPSTDAVVSSIIGSQGSDKASEPTSVSTSCVSFEVASSEDQPLPLSCCETATSSTHTPCKSIWIFITFHIELQLASDKDKPRSYKQRSVDQRENEQGSTVANAEEGEDGGAEQQGGSSIVDEVGRERKGERGKRELELERTLRSELSRAGLVVSMETWWEVNQLSAKVEMDCASEAAKAVQLLDRAHLSFKPVDMVDVVEVRAFWNPTSPSPTSPFSSFTTFLSSPFQSFSSSSNGSFLLVHSVLEEESPNKQTPELKQLSVNNAQSQQERKRKGVELELLLNRAVYLIDSSHHHQREGRSACASRESERERKALSEVIHQRFMHCGIINSVDTLHSRSSPLTPPHVETNSDEVKRKKTKQTEFWSLVHFEETWQALQAWEDWSQRGMRIQSNVRFVCVQFVGHLIESSLAVNEGEEEAHSLAHGTQERQLGGTVSLSSSSSCSSPKSRTHSLSSFSSPGTTIRARPRSSPDYRQGGKGTKTSLFHSQSSSDRRSTSCDEPAAPSSSLATTTNGSLNKRTRSSSPDLPQQIHMESMSLKELSIAAKRTKASEQKQHEHELARTSEGGNANEESQNDNETGERETDRDESHETKGKGEDLKDEHDTVSEQTRQWKVFVKHTKDLSAAQLQNSILQLSRFTVSDVPSAQGVSVVHCNGDREADELRSALDGLEFPTNSGHFLSVDLSSSRLSGSAPQLSTRKRRTGNPQEISRNRSRARHEETTTSKALEQLKLQGPNEGVDDTLPSAPANEQEKRNKDTLSTKRLGASAYASEQPNSKRAANLAKVRQQAELQLAIELEKKTEATNNDMEREPGGGSEDDNADSLADTFQSAVGVSSSPEATAVPAASVVSSNSPGFIHHNHHHQQQQQQQQQQRQQGLPHPRFQHGASLPAHPGAAIPMPMHLPQGVPDPSSHPFHTSDAMQQMHIFQHQYATPQMVPHQAGYYSAAPQQIFAPSMAPHPHPHHHPHHVGWHTYVGFQGSNHQAAMELQMMQAVQPMHMDHAVMPPTPPRPDVGRKALLGSHDRQDSEGTHHSTGEESAPLETSRLYVTYGRPLPEEALRQAFNDAAPGLEYVSRPREKCFVFVKYSTEAAAKLAMLRLNGKLVLGQSLRISIAQPPRGISCRKRQRTAELDKRSTFKK